MAITRTAITGAIALLGLAAGAASTAAPPLADQERVIYSAGAAQAAAGPNGRALKDERLHQLQTGALGGPEEFRARVVLAAQTDSRAIAAIHPLIVGAGAPASGWSRSGRVFTWRQGEERASPWTLPLAAAEKPAFRLADHGQVWIDFAAIGDVPVCEPRLELALDNVAPAGGSIRATTQHATSLETLRKIDAVGMPWQEKDLWYVARRIMGIEPDGLWRYAQAGRLAILQRRMNMALDGVDAVQIRLSEGTQIEHVNLRISASGGNRGGQVIEFPQPFKIETLLDGTQAVLINLRDALQARFPAQWYESIVQPGSAHFYLQEIAIFIPGQAQALSQSVPFRNVALVGRRMPEAGTMVLLQTTVTPINGHRSRLSADIAPLMQKVQAQMRAARLDLVAPSGQPSCAIELHDVVAASPYSEALPKYANRLERLVRGWGFHNASEPTRSGYVDAPRIIGYLPFAALGIPEATRRDSEPPQANGERPESRPESQGKAPGLNPANWQPYRDGGDIANKLGIEVSRLAWSDGTKLVVQGAPLRIVREGETLALEGWGSGVEIQWPLSAKLDEQSRFRLSVPGGAQLLGSVTLVLDLANGRSIERAIMPNELHRPVDSAVQVRRVRLRLSPFAAAYRLKLADMVFFEPATLSYADAFSAPLPMPHSVAPTPVVEPPTTPLLHVGAGHFTVLAGHTVGGPLHVSARLDPVLEYVSGVKLKYRLPSASLNDGACPLRVTLRWSEAATVRDICPRKPGGELFVPLPDLLGDRAPQKLGPLRSIEWVVRPVAASDATEIVDVRFSVEGWAMTSAADELRRAPLFHAGRVPVFAEPEAVRQIDVRALAQGVSLPIESASWARMVRVGGAIAAGTNGLFRVDSIVLAPVTPEAEARLKQLDERPVPAPPSRRWVAWLAIAAAIAAVWIAWIRGWWSPAAAIARGRTAALRTWRAASSMVRPRRTRHVHLAIGILAVGPGLWAAGRLGLSFRGVMVLFAALLAVWGAYARLREVAGSGSPNFLAHPSAWPPLTLGMGAALWSVSQHGSNPEAAWGLLPLLAGVYAALPALRQSPAFVNASAGMVGGMRKGRAPLSMVAWSLVAAMLYTLGAGNRAIGTDNAFFALGALAGVFALRGAMLTVRPWVAKRFPRAAERAYEGGGRLYFVLCLILIAATAVAVALRFDLVAEQLGIAFYYCFVIGIVKEAIARRAGAGHGEAPSSDAASSAPRRRG